MKDKIFDYVERDNWVFNLSGVTKLICFLILSAAVMFTYDLRTILVVMVLSFTVLRCSGITFSQIKFMLWAVLLFLGYFCYEYSSFGAQYRAITLGRFLLELMGIR